MSSATDTFAAWLDVLVDTLDVPDVTGGEIAARLHLSRFHLDRVVSAAAGEAPRALRRRVLLERSAFRLAASHRSVLDVAVEAGYGSHEAFARAFRRAYGRTPSAWREQPGPIRVEADNGIHFHPPAAIRLPAQRRVTAMDRLQKMVEHHVWLVGEIVDCATLLVDDRLDEPIVLSVEDDPDPSTLRRIISRLVGQMAMWNGARPDVRRPPTHPGRARARQARRRAARLGRPDRVDRRRGQVPLSPRATTTRHKASCRGDGACPDATTRHLVRSRAGGAPGARAPKSMS